MATSIIRQEQLMIREQVGMVKKMVDAYIASVSAQPGVAKSFKTITQAEVESSGLQASFTNGYRMWMPIPGVRFRSYNDTRDTTGREQSITERQISMDVAKQLVIPFSSESIRNNVERDKIVKAMLTGMTDNVLLESMKVAKMGSTAYLPPSGGRTLTSFTDFNKARAALTQYGVNLATKKASLVSSPENAAAILTEIGTRTLAANVGTESRSVYVAGEVPGDLKTAGFTIYQDSTVGLMSPSTVGSGESISVDTTSTASIWSVVNNGPSTVGSGGALTQNDSRYCNVTLNIAAGTFATTNFSVGNYFSIAGINSLASSTALAIDSGKAKTFRIEEFVGGTPLPTATAITVRISEAPIAPITGLNNSDFAFQHQNCVVNSVSASAAVTMLDSTNNGYANTDYNIPFWTDDSIVMIAGPSEKELMSFTEVNNVIYSGLINDLVRLTISRDTKANTNTQKLSYRADVQFGLACLNPSQCGALLFKRAV
jgi:hypothetical protein